MVRKIVIGAIVLIVFVAIVSDPGGSAASTNSGIDTIWGWAESFATFFNNLI